LLAEKAALFRDSEIPRCPPLVPSANRDHLLSFQGHKWRPNVEAGRGFNDDCGNQRWVFRAGTTLLLPTP
jgi:hypothetical protein